MIKTLYTQTHTLLLVILSVFAFNTNAQVQLCLGQDATVCPGQSVVITNCNAGGGNPVAGLYLNAPSQVNLSDDSWSGSVNIGFPFSFYGNNYSQCVIGSNGLISFNLANANGYCPWSLGGVGTLPNPGFAAARNTIMLTYQDINPSLGGQIQYQTIGTAPNRRFVVLYKNIFMFSCTSQCNYMAIILYETTNVFELHIGNKPLCNGWNGGLAIQGSENNPGNLAHITPGRNNSQWSANQDGRRFTPTAPNNTATYTMGQIPYLIVTSPGTNFLWANTLGQTFPYNNGVLNVPVVPPGTTGYFLSASACNTNIGSITQDTTWLTSANGIVTATALPDVCTQGIGSVTATPGPNSPAPYTFNWTPINANTQTVGNLLAGNYTVNMIDGNGCTATATVAVGDTPAAYNSTSTLVSCVGGNDGTATANMVPSSGNITYLWNNGQTTQTAVGLTAGTYTCQVSSSSGCSGSTTVVVTEIPPMILSIQNQIDASCNSVNNGSATIGVQQGTGPFFFDWDNSISTINTANDLGAGLTSITVTDANGCIDTISVFINEPSPLSIAVITPDTMICPEASINLSAVGTGGSSPYIYTWTENGTYHNVGSSITVDPANTNTTYCLTLSEQCGSPTTQACLVVTFPTPIQPNVVPDIPIACMPGTFTFMNTSVNGNEIASTQYDFSNGDSFTVPDLQDVTNSFPMPGLYSVTMTTTSIYGCVYTGAVSNIVEVTPLPTADFMLSKNPATWFETEIQVNDNSLGNITTWEWESVGSTSIIANGPNAIITYPEGVVGEYDIMLTVTTAQGCSDSIILELEIIPDIVFYAPNTFTPDDDEHNQTWKLYVEGIDQQSFELMIYNRWGEVVWETHDTKGEWDGTYGGKAILPGVYNWVAMYKLRDTDGKKTLNGFVQVLR
jgi:gliding motility-associated-like protein